MSPANTNTADPILRELAANNGAILCWQASSEAAFAEAAARGVITFDEDADCFVHPDAIKVADGAFAMHDGALT